MKKISLSILVALMVNVMGKTVFADIPVYDFDSVYSGSDYNNGTLVLIGCLLIAIIAVAIALVKRINKK